MAEVLAIVTAMTGLIIVAYVLIKTIKYIKTPCFTIQTQEGEQEATIMKYIVSKITPRDKATTQTTQPQPSVV